QEDRRSGERGTGSGRRVSPSRPAPHRLTGARPCPSRRNTPFPVSRFRLPAMTPELGQLALVLAFLLAIAQGVLPLIGAWRGNRALMAVARPAAAGQAVFVAMAFLVLVWAFLHFDFSVQYVADNSNLTLPWYYRIA